MACAGESVVACRPWALALRCFIEFRLCLSRVVVATGYEPIIWFLLLSWKVIIMLLCSNLMPLLYLFRAGTWLFSYSFILMEVNHNAALQYYLYPVS